MRATMMMHHRGCIMSNSHHDNRGIDEVKLQNDFWNSLQPTARESPAGAESPRPGQTVVGADPVPLGLAGAVHRLLRSPWRAHTLTRNSPLGECERCSTRSSASTLRGQTISGRTHPFTTPARIPARGMGGQQYGERDRFSGSFAVFTPSENSSGSPRETKNSQKSCGGSPPLACRVQAVGSRAAARGNSRRSGR